MYFKSWNPLRHDNFRSLISIGKSVPASFGCSFTEGVGVDSSQTWSFLLGVANCGLNGASNDLICRTAIEYCTAYSPSNIYVMWTFKNRREVIDADNTILKFKAYDPGSEMYAWHGANFELSNEHSDLYNFTKNKLMLESYCTANNILLHQLCVDVVENDTQGTDGMHPGVLWHEKIFNIFAKS